MNKFTVPKFRVDKRSVRDHVGILVYKHKKKLLAEEKATGITPDEPTELENLLDMIIALEESGEAELQETQGTASKKRQYDRAKVKDVRLKAMEKLSETKKRGSSEDESDDKPKRQPRSGGDAIEQSISWTFLNDAMAISAKESPKNQTDKERFAAASSCIATEILTLLFARKRRRSTGPVLYQPPRSRSRRVSDLKVPIVNPQTSFNTPL